MEMVHLKHWKEEMEKASLAGNALPALSKVPSADGGDEKRKSKRNSGLHHLSLKSFGSKSDDGESEKETGFWSE